MEKEDALAFAHAHTTKSFSLSIFSWPSVLCLLDSGSCVLIASLCDPDCLFCLFLDASRPFARADRNPKKEIPKEEPERNRKTLRKEMAHSYRMGLAALALLGLMAMSTVVAQHVVYGGESRSLNAHEKALRDLVLKHARAWAEPKRADLAAVLHPAVVFAYPTAKLDYSQSMADFDVFVEYYTNTTVTIPRDGILIDWKVGRVSVNWKFSTYARSNGVRQVVNDVCLGVVRDGRFVQWLEYLDGRVKTMQAAGALSYGDGPDGILKPWPAFVPGKEQCRAVVTVSCPAA